MSLNLTVLHLFPFIMSDSTLASMSTIALVCKWDPIVKASVVKVILIFFSKSQPQLYFIPLSHLEEKFDVL